MLTWLEANMGTAVITLALCAIVVGIIAAMVKGKKKGKSACGGSCGHCPMNGSCHHR